MNIDDNDIEISGLLPAEADCLLIPAREDARLWSREERVHMNMGGGGMLIKWESIHLQVSSPAVSKSYTATKVAMLIFTPSFNFPIQSSSAHLRLSAH